MKINETSVPLYEVTVKLDAPITECFKAGYEEKALMYWALGPKSVVYNHDNAEFPYGPGSKRTVTMNSKTSVIEVIELSEEPAVLGYNIPSINKVADRLITNYQGRMHFEPLDENHTLLTWRGYCVSSGWRLKVARVLFTKLITKMAKKLAEYVSKAS